MAPAFVDAWNNRGVLLAEMDLPQEACEAFRRALSADPRNAMAHSLADVLTDLEQPENAAPRWRAFLQMDSLSERAAYARRQLV